MLAESWSPLLVHYIAREDYKPHLFPGKGNNPTLHLQFPVSAHHFHTTENPKFRSRTMISLIIFHAVSTHGEKNTPGWDRNEGYERVIVLNSTVGESSIRPVTIIWCSLEKYPKRTQMPLVSRPLEVSTKPSFQNQRHHAEWCITWNDWNDMSNVVRQGGWGTLL